MDDQQAVEALTRFGLRTYEARVFLALQKLGTGTASDVAEVTDVPRSQVYGAAEGLEEKGLLEVQQTRPTVYRPVPPEEAERLLLAQLEQTGRDAFGYLESVRRSYDDGDEESEALWTVRGSESVRERTLELIAGATESVVYGVDDPDRLEGDVLEALSEAVDSGVHTAVVSDDPAVLDAVTDDAVETVAQPADHLADASTARLLLVDGDTILLSVLAPDTAEEVREIAFWSADTVFARALTRISAELFCNDPF